MAINLKPPSKIPLNAGKANVPLNANPNMAQEHVEYQQEKQRRGNFLLHKQ